MSTPFLRAAALAAALLPPLAGAQALSLEQAQRLAGDRSEAARASRSAALSAGESSHAAGQLPDPVLSAGIENLPVTGPDRFNTTADSMTMKRIGISQEWVSAEKRAARAAEGRALADRQTTQAAIAEAEARLQATLAYVDAWYAAQDLALATQGEHHLHEELEAARARLAAAAGSGAEALQLQSARGMAEDESEEARQQQVDAFLALARWVGFRPDALAAAPAFGLPAEGDFVARHPAVAALRGEADVARQAAAATAKERAPNWTWQVSYGQRTGYSDLVTVGVSIPLPVAAAQRQDRATAAQLALVDKAEAELAEATRAATSEYETLAADAQRLEQRVAHYRTAVALPAGQRTAAALAAYRSSQGPLEALFEARHAELLAQRKVLALERELARVEARLAFEPLARGGER
jgi:outer membrane protein TolC